LVRLPRGRQVKAMSNGKGRLRIRLERRGVAPVWLRIAVPVLSVVAAMALGAIILSALGYESGAAYARLAKGAFGSWKNVSESLLKSIPMMLCGLGVSISFKMSISNIGAEGQFIMGAWAATGIALFCDWIPEPLVLPAMFLAAFIGGAVWAVIAALPKALWGVNETIVSLLLNYVAMCFLDYFCYGIWRDVNGANMPNTAPFEPYARLPILFNNVHTGLIIALVAALLIFLVFKYTSRGYQIRMIGTNPQAAVYGGMKVGRNIILVMLFSGALAGLAGLAEVAGTTGYLQANVANGTGYVAITIAYLSNFNPFTVLLVSFLMGALSQGGYSIQLLGISTTVVTMLQGLILLCVLGGAVFIRNKVVVYREIDGGGDRE